MVRIDGRIYNGNVIYRMDDEHADISALLTKEEGFTDEEVMALQTASLLEELIVNYGVVEGVLNRFNLTGWRSVQRKMTGILFVWQTYKVTEIDTLKEQLAAAQEENKALEDALVELADIVGNEYPDGGE